MKRIILIFLFLPFISFSQSLLISNLNNTYNCAEGLLQINFRVDYAIDIENKFELEITIPGSGKKVIENLQLNVVDDFLVVHLPEKDPIPVGTYSISVVSIKPFVRSNELKESLQIIDKQYRPSLTLTPNESILKPGEPVALTFDYKDPKYPLHLQLNAYDEIDLLIEDIKIYDVPYIVNLPVSRSTYYKIINIGIGSCSLESQEYPEIVRADLEDDKPRIEWEPKNKDLCDASPDLISNRFKVYGDNNIANKYTVILINSSDKTEYPVDYKFFYATGDRFELPISFIKDLPSGKDYYFKIITENNIESDLLGPFNIEVLPTFSILNSEDINVNYGDLIKLDIDITGNGPWTFTIDENEVYTDTSPYVYSKEFKSGLDNTYFYINNGSQVSGTCANLISNKNKGFTTVSFNIPP
jgi:hypothetical protein